MNRKSFLKRLSALSLGLGLVSSSTANTMSSAQNTITAAQQQLDTKGSLVDFKLPPIPKVKIGMIGLGNRGKTLTKMLATNIKEGQAEIVALCDIRSEMVDKTMNLLGEFQKKKAVAYTNGDDAWRTMLQKEELDLVVIATPWRWHAPMAIGAMESGVNVACEVPIAYTMQECWDIVQTAERTQRHCIMIENCCYNLEEMTVLNMIDEGVFGELTHAEGAYIHDLRKHLLTDTYYEDSWRLHQHEERNGNFYTTHGLGPIAYYLGIGRGDNFDYLTSTSSLERNLTIAAQKVNKKIKPIACGDMNTTLIKTKKGRSIMLQFDVHTGRPYNRLNTVLGTKAVFQGYPKRLFIDGDELAYWGHNWLSDNDFKAFYDKYRPRVWTNLEEKIKDNIAGHGGMDFVMMYRLVRQLNLGLPLDMNVYDGVSWSAITPLSEISVANRSQSVNIPDFTNGEWKQERKHQLLEVV